MYLIPLPIQCYPKIELIKENWNTICALAKVSNKSFLAQDKRGVIYIVRIEREKK